MILNSLMSALCWFWVNQMMSSNKEAPSKPENCGCWFSKDKGQQRRLSLQLEVSDVELLGSLVHINQREKWAGCTQER
jgi:hypothetical protein